MTPRQFAWHLVARGPTLADWPQPEQDSALALLRRDQAAQQALAEALEFDEAAAPGAAAIAPMQAAIRRALAPIPAAALCAGIALSAVAGLYFGLTPQPEPPSGPVPTIQATLASTVLAAAQP